MGAFPSPYFRPMNSRTVYRRGPSRSSPQTCDGPLPATGGRDGKYEPERFADCQKAIEDGLLELLGVAIDAGWGKAEVIAAVIAVAENTQLAQDKFVGPSVALYLKKLSKKRD